MSNFQEQLERFAAMLPPRGGPRIARMKAGRDAYFAMLRTFAPGPADRPHLAGRISDLTGVPVDVFDDSRWPANLLVAIDQEGNAMEAWIIND